MDGRTDKRGTVHYAASKKQDHIG